MKNYFNKYVAFLYCVFFLVSGCMAAPSSWIKVGNELEDIIDPETGRTVRYLTAGKSMDTHFHYHNISWATINGKTYLFFSSSRKRPEAAGKSLPNEKQIMAVDLESGDLFYLTTIQNKNSKNASCLSFRPYYASYNDTAKTIFFLNKNRTKIYAYNILNGKQKLILTLPRGAISREFDDFVDEKFVRLIYPYTIADGNKSLGYIAVTDFDRDLNLIKNYVVKKCPTNEALNHVEIHPKNKNLFFYKHHKNQKPNGRYANAVLCVKDLSNPSAKDIAINPKRVIDHMIWGKKNDYIYWDDNEGSRWRFDWKTKKDKIIAKGTGIHNQLSSDENLWVSDYRKGAPYFNRKLDNFNLENWIGDIRIYNMKTKKTEKYANIIWGSPHPRHTHARFSPDDSMISFVTGTDDGYSRIAVMRVSAASEIPKKKLLYKDDFDKDLSNWVIEQASNGTVKIKNGKLEIDDENGCTVWFKKKLDNPLLIEYEVMIIKQGGPNDRGSDLNCFWMAIDPKHPGNIFSNKKRGGLFKNYHPLCLYYVGYGANNNTTTRFRRYPGGGERPCLPEHDLQDEVFMLTPNKWMKIQIVADGNQIQYFCDGRLIFNFLDKKPLKKGWFGFRTVLNHLLIDNFKVYRLPKSIRVEK